MQNGGTNKPIATIIAGLGGALLALGAVLTWATVSLDTTAFAKALGIDPAQIPIGSIQTSKSFAGTNAAEGKWALVCGIVVLILAIAAWARGELRKPLGIVTVVAGAIGGGVAVYDITTKNQQVSDALSQAAPALKGLGIDPSVLNSVFSVTFGIGIYVCVLGGALAVVGGVMILTQKSAAPVPAMAGATGGFAPPPPADMGFGTATPAAPAASSMPAAPVEAPTATMDPSTTSMDPPAAPVADPPSPAGDGDAEDGPSSS